MIDGRCGVQNQCGHETIPKICASYPRAFYRFSSKENALDTSKIHEEISGFSLVHLLLEVFGMVLGKKRTGFRAIPRLKLAEDFTSAGLYARKYSYIRNQVQILLQSNLKLAQKMAVVASAVRFFLFFFIIQAPRTKHLVLLKYYKKLLM